MPSELDHAPHLLLLTGDAESKTEKALSDGAISVLEKAGATFETIQVKQIADLALAASFAARSRTFDAIIVVADVSDKTDIADLIASGLQQVGIQEKTSIAFAKADTSEEATKLGANAADSALRLFAIKARFNPMLNEA